jgi:hypothetical protein
MLLFVRVVEELRVVVFQVRDAGVLGFDRVQEVPGSAVLQVVLLGQLELDKWKIRCCGKFV